MAGVVYEGRVAHLKGYGLSDIEARTPVTPAKQFRPASLTKQLLA